MSDEELRLECLKIAAEGTKNTVYPTHKEAVDTLMVIAERFARFVCEGDANAKN